MALNGNEERQLVELLKRVDPGYYSVDLFHALLRLVVSTTYVVIPFRRMGDRIDVHLIVRDLSDPHYGGQLHTAGTVIRASDRDLSCVYRRLVRSELSDVDVIEGPVFVGVVFDEILRGKEVSLIHWIEVESASDNGFYDMEDLPDTIVDTDRPRIMQAFEHYRTGV